MSKKKEKRDALTNKYLYAYVKMDNGGVITFCIERGLDREYNQYIEYNVSFCSPSDQFSKSKGRGIARVRLVNNKDSYLASEWETHSFDGRQVKKTTHAYQEAVIESFFEWLENGHRNRNVPSWVRSGKPTNLRQTKDESNDS